MRNRLPFRCWVRQTRWSRTQCSLLEKPLFSCQTSLPLGLFHSISGLHLLLCHTNALLGLDFMSSSSNTSKDQRAQISSGCQYFIQLKKKSTKLKNRAHFPPCKKPKFRITVKAQTRVCAVQNKNQPLHIHIPSYKQHH